MTLKVILATWTVVLLSNVPSSLSLLGRQVINPMLLESYNIAGKFLSYGENNVGKLDALKGYNIRAGLTGESKAVSIESVDKPNFFLRQSNTGVNLEDAASAADPTQFKKDATFRVHEERWKDETVSFESSSKTNYFLRHKDGLLTMSVDDGTDLFKADASWKMLKSSKQTTSPLNYQDLIRLGTSAQSPAKYLFGSASKTSMAQNSILFYIRPGLTGEFASVSLEVKDKMTDYYLRQDNYEVYCESIVNPKRSKTTLLEDATFRMIHNNWHPNTVSFESIRNPDYFLSHKEDDTVVISPRKDTADFKAAASWTVVERKAPYGGPKSFELNSKPGNYMSFDAKSGKVKLSTVKTQFYTRKGFLGYSTFAFESVDRPNHFLTDNNNLLELQDANNPKEPRDFKDYASFKIYVYKEDTVAFGSGKKYDTYISYQNNELRMLERGQSKYSTFAERISWNLAQIHVLVDVSGSLNGSEMGLSVSRSLFSYMALDEGDYDGFISVVAKTSLVTVTPFTSRLLSKKYVISPALVYSGLELEDNYVILEMFYKKLQARGYAGWTDVGKSLKQAAALHNRGRFSIIIISDFLNTLTKINPVDVVKTLSANSVQVFPVLVLDARRKDVDLFNHITAATIDKKGYDTRNFGFSGNRNFNIIEDIIQTIRI